MSPPGEARREPGRSSSTSRAGSARADKFTYADNEDIFDELRRASAGGTADYAGITWERIEREMGVFWPCPAEGHPGTPRLFEGGRFYHPDGKFHLYPTPYRLSAEVVDDEYPLAHDAGAERLPVPVGHADPAHRFLVEQYPGPLCEMHPSLAARLGLADGSS